MNKESYEKLKPLIGDYVKGKLNKEEVVSLFQKLLDSELIWGFPTTYEKKLYELVDEGLVKVTEATKEEFRCQRESAKRFDDSLTEEERKEMEFENTTLMDSFQKLVKISVDMCFKDQLPVYIVVVIDRKDEEHYNFTGPPPPGIKISPKLQEIQDVLDKKRVEDVVKEHGVKAILTAKTITFPGLEGKKGILIVTLEVKTPVKSGNLAVYRNWLYEFKGGNRKMIPFPYSPPFGEDDGGGPFMPSDNPNAPKWIKLYFRRKGILS